jgi:Holliday junction resolvasome RuvABC ATP-dependent DNA helicase subunit
MNKQLLFASLFIFSSAYAASDSTNIPINQIANTINQVAHQVDLSHIKIPPVSIQAGIDPELGKNIAENLLTAGNEVSGPLNAGTLKYFSTVNTGLAPIGRDMVNGFKEIRNAVLIGSGIMAGISLIGTAIQTISTKYILKYFFEPQLIEERSPSSWFWSSKTETSVKKSMVVSPALAYDLDYLIHLTKNTKKNGGEYENVLLHGLPGTGKTLFAKLLAKSSGMRYAFVPAANVSQFLTKGTAVEELNKLFNWAEKNKKGTLLFFDEAETFLGKRELLSEHAQNALSIFLARTGTASSRVMIVCATNRPEALDPAVVSRLGIRIEFPLPTLEERIDQIKMHIASIFGTQKAGAIVDYSLLTNDLFITNLAERLEGVSGRVIQKTINRIRQAALADDSFLITETTVNNVINRMMQ